MQNVMKYKEAYEFVQPELNKLYRHMEQHYPESLNPTYLREILKFYTLKQEADLITNLPPKVKEILEKLSESGAKVKVMKVEV